MQTNPLQKIGRHATCLFSACLIVAHAGSVASGANEKPTVLGLMDGDTPSGMLRTIDGRLFIGVRDARPEPTGLTFRHSIGAARIPREKLSEADQKRFGLPPLSAPAAKRSVMPPTIVATTIPLSSSVMPAVLTFRIRTTLPTYAGMNDTSCAGALSQVRWPSHWSRPHYGLAYPIFPCRQAAERDFLITSGILPRPAGVQTWRLR